MKISIIGFGKFGQLLASLLKEIESIDLKVFDEQTDLFNECDFTFVSLEEACLSDVVILSVPISNLVTLLNEIKLLLKPNCLVVDVCSVKVFPIQAMQKILPSNVEILGTHPMWGPESVKINEGVQGLKTVLCPVRIGEEKLVEIIDLLESVGMKIIQKSASEHDEDAAHSQALAQFVGKVLELLPLKNIEIGTMGYDQLKGLLPFIENNSDQLFNDLQSYNPFSSPIRKRFIEISLMLSNDLNKKEQKKSVYK